MAYGDKVWYYYYDQELRVFHTRNNCTGAKIANKYNYLKPFTLHSNNTEEARRMDQMGTACDICFRYEQRTARYKRNYAIPPGFRKAA